MRWTIGAMTAAAIMLAACGPSKQEKRAIADANAANFIPPSVTSRADFGISVDRRFHALDRNGDNYITPDEMPAKNRARLMSFDKDGDGKVSAIEFSDGQLAQFDGDDLNHDGTVTSEEHQAARAGAAPAPTGTPAVP
ncbi:hypothetical protein [uncultured Sphingomonas sp.]|uniref:hypothetical protein n=1 Tax=uncultured Sphingomonas sp. TaxID=158754 RepID=UPI0035CA4A1E